MAEPRRFARWMLAGMVLAWTPIAMAAPRLLPAGNDLGDRASLQRGAGLYMNYCSGCHSLKYLRYSRLGEDLHLSERQVRENLDFAGAAAGGPIVSAMPPEQAAGWFGKAPPDLSLVARVRGEDWIYTYLKSFYADPAQPLGWNNAVFANAAMPNVLWSLQGVQQPVAGRAGVPGGEPPVVGLKLVQAGTQSPAEFDRSVRDITNFLAYAAEPAALQRRRYGPWVVAFLLAFTALAWRLKRAWWKDVA